MEKRLLVPDVSKNTPLPGAREGVSGRYRILVSLAEHPGALLGDLPGVRAVGNPNDAIIRMRSEGYLQPGSGSRGECWLTVKGLQHVRVWAPSLIEGYVEAAVAQGKLPKDVKIPPLNGATTTVLQLNDTGLEAAVPAPEARVAPVTPVASVEASKQLEPAASPPVVVNPGVEAPPVGSPRFVCARSPQDEDTWVYQVVVGPFSLELATLTDTEISVRWAAVDPQGRQTIAIANKRQGDFLIRTLLSVQEVVLPASVCPEGM